MMGRSPGSEAVQSGGVGPQRLPHGWGGYPDKAIPNTAWLRQFFGQEMVGRVRYEMYGVRCMVAPQLAVSIGLSWEAVASLQQRGSSCLLTVLSTHCLPGFWPSLQQQHNLPVTQGAVFALLSPKTTVPWRAACN